MSMNGVADSIITIIIIVIIVIISRSSSSSTFESGWSHWKLALFLLVGTNEE